MKGVITCPDLDAWLAGEIRWIKLWDEDGKKTEWSLMDRWGSPGTSNGREFYYIGTDYPVIEPHEIAQIGPVVLPPDDT